MHTQWPVHTHTHAIAHVHMCTQTCIHLFPNRHLAFTSIVVSYLQRKWVTQLLSLNAMTNTPHGNVEAFIHYVHVLVYCTKNFMDVMNDHTSSHTHTTNYKEQHGQHYQAHPPFWDRGCLLDMSDKAWETPAQQGKKQKSSEWKGRVKKTTNEVNPLKKLSLYSLTDCSQFNLLYVFVVLDKAMTVPRTPQLNNTRLPTHTLLLRASTCIPVHVRASTRRSVHVRAHTCMYNCTRPCTYVYVSYTYV